MDMNVWICVIIAGLIANNSGIGGQSLSYEKIGKGDPPVL